MTISPGFSVGHRNCRTYTRNTSPFMGSSKTIGVVGSLTRNPAMKLIVFQCPCGMEAIQRSPFCAPRSCGRMTGFVQKYQLRYAKCTPTFLPLMPRFLHVFAFLLAGVQRVRSHLFNCCHNAGTLMVTPCSPRRSYISANVRAGSFLSHSRNNASLSVSREPRYQPIAKLQRSALCVVPL